MRRVDGPQTRHIGKFSARQHREPSRGANASRNAGAERGRHRRWAPARDALWGFVEPHLRDGARVAVLGAGSWGTTFAKVLADAGCEVRLWARRAEVAAAVNDGHANPDYLPGVELPMLLTATTVASAALEGQLWA